LARAQNTRGVAFAFASRHGLKADGIAQPLLEQDGADALVSADQRYRARVVSFVVDRAGEGIERQNLVAPSEVVLAEGYASQLLACAQDAARPQHALWREEVAVFPASFNLEAFAGAIANAPGDGAQLGRSHLHRNVDRARLAIRRRRNFDGRHGHAGGEAGGENGTAQVELK